MKEGDLLSPNKGTEVAKDSASVTRQAQQAADPKKPAAAQPKALPAAPMTRSEALRKRIEDERKVRFGFIHDVRAARNRLSYKIADKAAISQLSEVSKSGTKNIGFLRRKKEQLEFRIATEAFTVEAEKDLIRKKNEIEQELEKALKSFRLRKKLEFIDKDIKELTGRIAESEAKIKESDKRLDELYSSLRAMTGESNKPRQERKQQREQPKAQEISLADIAIIKDKKEGKADVQEADDSVLN